MRTYPVVGGWHACDDSLGVACFGLTEAEAISALALMKAQITALIAAAQGENQRILAETTPARHAPIRH